MTGLVLIRQSLQRQILVVFLLLGAALMAGAWLSLQIFVVPAFQEYEWEQSVTNLSRASRALAHYHDELNTLGLEFARWDSTYQHIQQPERFADFAADISRPAYWSRVGMDAMLFYDRGGELLWGQRIDPYSAELLPVDQLQTGLLSLGSPLLVNDTNTVSRKGYLVVGDANLQLGFFPVLRSDGSGPALGTLVVGRELTPERLAGVALNAGVELALKNIKPAVAATGPPALLSDQVPGAPRGNSGGTTISRKLIDDLSGRPALALETRTLRRISFIGEDAVATTLLFLSLGIGLFVLAGWWTSRELMLGPVFAMKRHIVNLRRTGDLGRRFHSSRLDEFGTLGNEFDRLTAELEISQKQTQLAREEAEASSRAKSDFLATMSHEIRTPMNGVLGMTEVLLRTDLNDRQRRLAGVARASGELLLNVINDILDFSKISAGKMLIEQRPFRLRDLVADLSDMMAGSAQDKGIEYLCQIDSELPEMLVADDQRLRQVLVNLIGNAIKFTEKGEVVLTVEPVVAGDKDSEAGQYFVFSVSDTGVGIPGELQEHIFDAFSQADGTTTRRFGGTGLGLAICKQLVEKMGGNISVESTPGQGATFRVALPMLVQQENAGADRKPEASNLEGLKVLVIDDSATNRDILRSHLAHWQTHCSCASGGEEALEFLRAAAERGNCYDLLLIDYHMPGMDGLELASLVRERSELGSPMMVMLSSMADQFSTVDLDERGISGCLSKPVLESDLYQHLVQTLGRSTVTAGRPPIDSANDESAPLIDALDVLVVEDNPVNQELIVMQLEDKGYRVDLAENGERALAMLEQQQYDMAIMDCQMPVMDGYEATRLIREIGYTSRDGSPLPILAMTANVSEEDRNSCLDAGMDAYIRKPYQQEELLQIMCRLVPHRTSQTQLDREALANVSALQREGAPNILHRMIDLYLETSPNLVDEMTAGVTEGDARVVQMSAHTLKSSSAVLGASELAELCRQLEEMGRNAELDDCQKLLSGLAEEFARVCDALALEKVKS
ncbi:MAG: response regulator [Halieaceae bacterium]